MWSRLAPMTDKQELVSPRTRTALPNEPVPPMIIRGNGDMLIMLQFWNYA